MASAAKNSLEQPCRRARLPTVQGYRVREIFRTLQGEGGQTGTPMVFVRFAGCNLWSGHERDRERDAARSGAACPRYCDTDFVSGEPFTVDALLARVVALAGPRWICWTGGEPALQLDRPLLAGARSAGYRSALETNGTVALDGIRDLLDWVCVSPKLDGADWRVREGDELKLVYRGQGADELRPLESMAFRHFLLQPEWGPRYQQHLDAALALLQGQSRWRLSLQTHKLVGLP
jgi:organic radical activating enzyme